MQFQYGQGFSKILNMMKPGDELRMNQNSRAAELQMNATMADPRAYNTETEMLAHEHQFNMTLSPAARR